MPLEIKDLGIIIPNDGSPLLTRAVGHATHETNGKFRVAVNPDHSPVIESLRTGKVFTLPWAHLLALAEERGILEP